VSKRSLHLNGQLWKYLVSNNKVIIWSPEGKKKVLLSQQFSPKQIKPSDVKLYIVENLCH
jgi:hypothetical protein